MRDLRCLSARRLPGAGFRAVAGGAVEDGRRVAGATTAGSAELVSDWDAHTGPVITELKLWVWVIQPISYGVSEEPQMSL